MKILYDKWALLTQPQEHQLVRTLQSVAETLCNLIKFYKCPRAVLCFFSVCFAKPASWDCSVEHGAPFFLRSAPPLKPNLKKHEFNYHLRSARPCMADSNRRGRNMLQWLRFSAQACADQNHETVQRRSELRYTIQNALSRSVYSFPAPLQHLELSTVETLTESFQKEFISILESLSIS